MKLNKKQQQEAQEARELWTSIPAEKREVILRTMSVWEEEDRLAPELANYIREKILNS